MNENHTHVVLNLQYKKEERNLKERITKYRCCNDEFTKITFVGVGWDWDKGHQVDPGNLCPTLLHKKMKKYYLNRTKDMFS